MIRKISVKQGEAEYQEFAVLTNGSPVNIESAICTFKVVDSDDTELFTIENADISKSNNIATVPFSAMNTNNTPGNYTGELKVYLSSTSIKKSENISFTIEKSIS